MATGGGIITYQSIKALCDGCNKPLLINDEYFKIYDTEGNLRHGCGTTCRNRLYRQLRKKGIYKTSKNCFNADRKPKGWLLDMRCKI